MVAVESLDSLELRRRVSGLKFTELSRRSGISYKRLWRFFRDDGPLTRIEMQRLDTILPQVEDSQ